jgi:23S rRNA pseudouridine1911/1915/1917 synthase
VSDLFLPPRIAPPALDGLRLDQALAALFPELAALGRRRLARLWEHYDARVDGRSRVKGFRIRAGQTLELRLQSSLPPPSPDILPPGLRVVARAAPFAALSKPTGLHCARRDPKPGASPALEELLPLLFPDEPCAFLLNRLDFPTSGLVLVGLEPSARDAYKAYEDAGQVEKTYRLLVRGRLEQELLLKNALDTARRDTTRVLDELSEDPLRWTRLRPLLHSPAVDSLPEITLALALIKKGSRHQIRAHCGHAGFPILGDGRYGDPEAEKSPLRISLHHERVSFPGFTTTCPPEWETMGVEATEQGLETEPVCSPSLEDKA